MEIDINLFLELYAIAKRHKIRQVAWGKVSGDTMSQKRIAELVAKARGRKYGRPLTISKYYALIGGLIAIMGVEKFGEEFMPLISKEGNTRTKIIKQTIFVLHCGQRAEHDRLASLLELLVNNIKVIGNIQQ